MTYPQKRTVWRPACTDLRVRKRGYVDGDTAMAGEPGIPAPDATLVRSWPPATAGKLSPAPR